MDDDTVAVDYDELKLSGYTVMTLPDEDRMSGNVCELEHIDSVTAAIAIS